eukprot:65056-Amphidinium_carterae.2
MEGGTTSGAISSEPNVQDTQRKCDLNPCYKSERKIRTFMPANPYFAEPSSGFLFAIFFKRLNCARGQ